MTPLNVNYAPHPDKKPFDAVIDRSAVEGGSVLDELKDTVASPEAMMRRCLCFVCVCWWRMRIPCAC
eukprot:1508579-Rhodomonas_salina.1